MAQQLLDKFQRNIEYMRISVTDNCNLRCVYCNTSTKQHLNHVDVLSYEEIARVVRIAAHMGVHSIRLTGGEPTVRPHIEKLIEMLRSIEGINDISMTTNAIRLTEMAQSLKKAGLNRVNISLDTFKAERYTQMCGFNRITDVLQGIEAAKQAGLNPLKINTVVLRGVNDDEVLDFARKSFTDGWNVRYIEEMPLVDNPNGHKMVSICEIRESIENNLGYLEPCYTSKGCGPAKYFRLSGSRGSIGFIGPVTDCFCEKCNRFRLTADGKLRPCLLYDDEVDLRQALRGGASDVELESLIQQTAIMKHEKHQLADNIAPHGRSMRQIGG